LGGLEAKRLFDVSQRGAAVQAQSRVVVLHRWILRWGLCVRAVMAKDLVPLACSHNAERSQHEPNPKAGHFLFCVIG
jgi:hypothetical protein